MLVALLRKTSDHWVHSPAALEKTVEFKTFAAAVRDIRVGKQLPDAVYVHRSVFEQLPNELRNQIQAIAVDFRIAASAWNVLKLYKRDFKVALLNYPTFDSEAFPSLAYSITLDLGRRSIRRADFSQSDNPPILHRKELLIGPTHPDFNRYAEITRQLEADGLFSKPTRIGFKRQWEKLLARAGYEVIGSDVTKKEAAVVLALPSIDVPVAVQRHLTAIDRNKLSQPMQFLARHGFLDGSYSVFDYGCGKGDDIRELEAHGINICGWDPVHRPTAEVRKADIVNLGFVINVIEDRHERTETLRKAFSYSERLLVISAMVAGPATISQFRSYKDGVITARHTFQKYYSQSELKEYVESSLGENAIALAPGIFAVFKDKLAEQILLSERQRVHRTWQQLSSRKPKKLGPDAQLLYAQHQSLFDYFRDTAVDLGRIPANDEFEYSERLRSIARSHNHAFEILKERYGTDCLEQAHQARKGDLLVYFALGLFGQRKPYKDMPEGLRRDIKAFFGGYPAALESAKQLLFSVASPSLIEREAINAYAQFGCGILSEGHSLVIHRSLQEQLPPVLRVYVGCALQLYGDVDDIDVIKIHFRSGKVTLMKYEQFAESPLPNLLERIKINLREQEIDEFNYGKDYPPQPLYIKSRLLPPAFPAFEKQRKFDVKLQALGLFDFSGYGPSKMEFQSKLAESGYRIAGFQLTKSKTRAL